MLLKIYAKNYADSRKEYKNDEERCQNCHMKNNTEPWTFWKTLLPHFLVVVGHILFGDSKAVAR